MSKKLWKASAQSNIAVVKYMGKESGGINQATNPSLSMTLSDFRTSVELELLSSGEADRWEPLPGSSPLRVESTKRFVEFFQKLKAQEKISQNFLLRSGNNFPSDAGLASSASSFAALTKCAELAFSELANRAPRAAGALANISRTGSGSSCRSFFSPWCAWEGEKIYASESKLEPLVDVVILHESGFKKVSSSEAHKRVKSSPLFEGRSVRAQERMKQSLAALRSGDFKILAEIAWAESWDMHSLFHTSSPPFFYFAPQTIAVLRFVENFWEKNGFGPLATIDAGPNVHLFMKLNEKEKILAELRAEISATGAGEIFTQESQSRAE